MRSTDERMAAVKACSHGLRVQRRRNRSLVATVASAAVSLVLLVCFALYIPTVYDGSVGAGAGTSGLYGSIMAAGGYLGYIVIGVLAFCLGAAVTLLCVKLRERDDEDAEPWI